MTPVGKYAECGGGTQGYWGHLSFVFGWLKQVGCVLGRHHPSVLSHWPSLALFKGGAFPAGLRDREDLLGSPPEPDDAAAVPRPMSAGEGTQASCAKQVLQPWNFLICSRFRKQ